MSVSPPIPAEVQPAFDEVTPPERAVLLQLRSLIYSNVSEIPEAGAVTETLKWGQPSYSVPTGTPIRLGLTSSGTPALFVHCQTSVVSDARPVFDGDVVFEGNRAVLVPVDQAFPEEVIGQIIHAALTYRQKTRSGRSG